MGQIDLRRRTWTHVQKYYIPSAVIVSISFLVLWFPASAFTSRIGLTLTLIMTLASSHEKVQMSAQFHALDVWYAICIGFLFLSLIELVIAMRMSEGKPPAGVRKGSIVPAMFKQSLWWGIFSLFLQLFRLPIIIFSLPAQFFQFNSYENLADQISRRVLPLAYLIASGVYYTVYVAHPPPQD